MMAVYHQIGHDSENLLFEQGLSRIQGAILSPLNYGPGDVAEQVRRLAGRENFVTILDPHLYRPSSGRMCLPEWTYYPTDVDTADLSNEAWWAPTVDRLGETAVELGVNAVASPTIVPRAFQDEFFLLSVSNNNRLAEVLSGTPVRPMQTVVASLPDLGIPGRASTIASIVSRSRSPEFLLIFVGDVEPRRELADAEELKGAMRLISALESGGQPVTVAFSSSDIVLWKEAGATNCASGKFFNLRRFTISRFDEPNGSGGGQLGYWFEEALMAFLRQSDLIRVRERALLSQSSQENVYAAPIFEAIPANQAWVALGWRQFLYWCADVEARLRSHSVTAEQLILTADANWSAIEQSRPRLFMEERQNDGAWVRQWLRAIVEFPYFR